MSFRLPFSDSDGYEPARLSSESQRLQMLRDCLAAVSAYTPDDGKENCRTCGGKLVRRFARHEGLHHVFCITCDNQSKRGITKHATAGLAEQKFNAEL